MKIENDVKHVPGTYLIIDDKNKKAYVGSTGNLRERAMNHRSYLRNGKHPNKELQEHYNNCEGNLSFIAVELEDKEVALELEQSIIDDLYQSGLLCNKGIDAVVPTKGLKFKHTEEQNRRKSEMQVGRRHSIETINKMSILGKQRGIPALTKQLSLESCSKKVIADGVQYDSLADAGRALHVSYTCISKRAKSDNFPNYSFVDNEGS